MPQSRMELNKGVLKYMRCDLEGEEEGIPFLRLDVGIKKRCWDIVSSLIKYCNAKVGSVGGAETMVD